MPGTSLPTFVLFDSGALHASYVSKDLVDKHRELFDEFIVPVNVATRLADSMTTLNITVVDSKFVRQFPSLAPRRNPRRH